jgi:hypothetical protein
MPVTADVQRSLWGMERYRSECPPYSPITLQGMLAHHPKNINERVVVRQAGQLHSPKLYRKVGLSHFASCWLHPAGELSNAGWNLSSYAADCKRNVLIRIEDLRTHQPRGEGEASAF